MKDDSAFPIIGGHMEGFGASPGHEGLTKRELFSAMILQGLSVEAIPGMHNSWSKMIREAIPKAVAMADALIEELEKTNEKAK